MNNTNERIKTNNNKHVIMKMTLCWQQRWRHELMLGVLHPSEDTESGDEPASSSANPFAELSDEDGSEDDRR